MEDLSFTYRPIGVIRSNHTDPDRTPVQPAFASGHQGRVELLPEFADGLRDLDGFSHVYLVYHLHEAGPAKLVVKPFLEDAERGLFATRAPCRPNPVGISIVRLKRCEGSVLHVENIDVLDGTPLLDIKPYVGKFDCIEGARGGWTDGIDEETAERRGRREGG